MPEHLSHVPEHLSRVPEHLSHVPEHLSHVPEHLSHVPEHLSHVPEHLSVAVRMWSSWFTVGSSVVMCVLVVGLRASLVLHAGVRVSKKPLLGSL